MKVSIITVSFNAASTITDAINSVASQEYDDIEHIIVDGCSTDETVEIIKKSVGQADNKIKWISDPDRGIYDAMNKGIEMATGDVIGILNADDYYFDNHVVANVAQAFQDPEIDAVFGDLIVIDPNKLNKTVRTYRSNKWTPYKFGKGYMPAHPTFFTRKKNYDKFGLFETNYEIAADYEMLIRLLYTHKLNYQYLPMTMVKMRKGGVSSRGIRSNVVLNKEIIRACKKHGIKTNVLKIYPKYFKKIFELINH